MANGERRSATLPTPRPDRVGIHSASVGEDLVMLDVAADAYRYVPGGAASLSLAPNRALPPLPRRSIIHEPARFRPDAGRALDALKAWRAVERAKAQGGLAPFLALATATGSIGPPKAVEREALWLWTFAPWLPDVGVCLERSALLMAYLARRGLAAEWVFGVRLWPFAAHCWVQCGDACLNDDWERLVAFSPILRR